MEGAEKPILHDIRHWNVIYPVYLNAKKTMAEGRRVPLSIAVENPSPTEIAEVCKYLGLEAEIEPDKAYSRDYTQRGRVRVNYKNDKKALLNAEVTSKKVLFAKLCTLIPKLNSRTSKSSITTSTTATSTTKAGKKGKKK